VDDRAADEHEEESGSSPPPAWFAPVLVGIAVVIALGLAEVALRITWHNPYRNLTANQYIHLRTQRPFSDIPINRSQIYPESPTTAFRTSERSYIEPSRRFESADLEIAFLGGSTTACRAVDEELRFPALVSTLLLEKGLRVNSLNAGVSGNTTHDSIHVLLNHVVFDTPDIAVMMHAANDSGVLAKTGDYKSRTGHELTLGNFMTWLSSHASRYSWIAAVRRYYSSRAFTGHPTGAFDDWANEAKEQVDFDARPFEHRLRAFIALAHAFDIEPVLMTQPAITMATALTPGWMHQRNQERLNQIIRDVAADEEVVLIDLVNHLINEVEDWDVPMVIFYDGVHVTTKGSVVYAKHITEVLYERLIPKLLRERAG